MWFLNKETGLTWEVAEQELIQRLQANSNYEQTDEPKNEESSAETPDAKLTKRNDKESA